ncbi:MAG TPA: DUF554 domain-containing protein [Candidatus Salinicoccus stercoripullorum]|uniref:Membrane protein n=2 Tax=Salinicoccus TaxID=45669 RepID=A0A0M2SM13_9STAP|nr:DUF554 domain-containing protein [Salinicoccus sediminis]KKK35268.1 membrane protein [Salinicoccus sediminis]HIW11840.1 DUF554 domain-containing protein [Candidatus Salinicoccus stercoripullorum]
MMFMGAVANGLAIVIGGLLGLIFTFIPEPIKDSIMKIQALVIMTLGIQMVVQAEDIIVTLLSLIIGVVIGEVIRLEEQLNRFGHWMEFKLGDKHAGNLSQGFVSGTLVFIVGAMAIVGGLDAGLRGSNEVLYTKSIMDFFIAIVMTTTYGLGVIISGVPAFLYESGIIVSASQIARLIPEYILDQMILQVSATGGVILLAIGLNMLNVTKMRVGNMIPAIFTAMAMVYIINIF